MKRLALALCILLTVTVGLTSCQSSIPRQPLPDSAVFYDYLGQDRAVVFAKLGEPLYKHKSVNGDECLTYPRSRLSMLLELRENKVAKVTYSTGSKRRKSNVRNEVMGLYGNGLEWNTIDNPSKPWLANRTLVMELADHSRLIYEDEVNLTVSSVDKL